MFFVFILFRFIRVIREGDWVLYFFFIVEMFFWFVVFDYVNYF